MEKEQIRIDSIQHSFKLKELTRKGHRRAFDRWSIFFDSMPVKGNPMKETNETKLMSMMFKSRIVAEGTCTHYHETDRECTKR